MFVFGMLFICYVWVLRLLTKVLFKPTRNEQNNFRIVTLNSSHTNHEFLILVIPVTNVSLTIESFVTYEKVLIMMLHKENFPTSKIVIVFFFSLI